MTATRTRDAHGIPQIVAHDLIDLHHGMGYSHAEDRGLQMLMMRILGQGRGAELLDGGDEMVEIDTFFRRHNFGRDLEAEVELLDPVVAACVYAYCDGVNARFAESVPWELRLLRVRPEPWTPGDSLLIARMTGFLTLAQSQGEVERLFVQMVQAGIDDARLEALFPGSTDGLDRGLINRVAVGERLVPQSVRWASGAVRLMASNNWCVRGALTRSGAAMLANDPHLETNRLPNVWAEQTLSWNDGHVLVMTMPGLPAPLVGRNRHLAWGATYTFMDAIDSWIEECQAGQVRRGEQWMPLRRRDEVIARRGGDAVWRTFFESEHGVLDGDAEVDGFYLATRWSGSSGGARSINAIHRMWTASTVEEGMNAFADVESSFNWVFADTAGDIGYQMSGAMPHRPADWNGFAPRSGADPRYAWAGWVAPEDLPRVQNPPNGIIVTANQDLNHLGTTSPINMPMGDYRARRIEQLLAARDDHDVESFRAMQMDVYSLQAEEFLAILTPLLGTYPLAEALRAWDCCYDPDSLGATAFEHWYSSVCRQMFGPGCGAAVIKHLQDKTGIFADFYANFDAVLLDPHTPWLAERTQQEVFSAALHRVSHIEPTPWGQQNQITLSHMLLGGRLPRLFGFDHGPIPLRGGRATVHQGQIYAAGDRVTSFTPSMRLVADMADDVLHTAICGGSSDRRSSKFYVNRVRGWLAGELQPRR